MSSRAVKCRRVAVRWRVSTLRAMSIVACAVVLAAAALAAHQAQPQGQPARTQSQLLLDGIHKMEDNGDYRGAVHDLEAASQGRDRQIAATALLHLGDAQQRLGWPQARATYETIVKKFGDQAEVAAQARDRLAHPATPPPKLRPPRVTVRRLWGVDEFLALGPPSPDGQAIPGCVRNMSLRSWEPAVSRAGSLEVRRLAPAAPNENVQAVIFSPDGAEVAALWRLPGGPPYRFELRTYAAAGGRSRTVFTHQPSGDGQLAGWTPDGKSLIVCFEDVPGTREFGAIDTATGGWKSIARVDGIVGLFGQGMGYTAPLLSMSPDHRFIAYSALHTGRVDYDIDVLELATGVVRTLVGGPASDVFPLWTADGRLLFMSDRVDKNDLWLVDVADGRTRGEPQVVRRDPAIRVPIGLSADGGSLYYRAEDGRQNVAISALDPERGAASVPVIVGRLQGLNRIPDWSPDGRRLAYTSASGVAFSQQNSVLVIVDAQSGDERAVATASRDLGPLPRWSPDGRSVTLMAATREQARFTRVDVETGAAETIVLMKKPQSQVTEFEWTPDGRALIYARDFHAVMRYDVESEREQTLYEAPAGKRLNKPVLSHDGSRIAVSQWDDKVDEVLLVPLDGAAVRPIFTAKPGYQNSVAGWGPSDMVFVSTYKVLDRPEDVGSAVVLRVPANGGPPLPTGLEAPDIQHPRVSRDGLHFAFTFGRNSQGQYVLENFLPPPRKAIIPAARRQPRR
ncbi:MAG: hypothetical protein ACM3NQ_09885 [Bacteroidales bacterium]